MLGVLQPELHQIHSFPLGLALNATKIMVPSKSYVEFRHEMVGIRQLIEIPLHTSGELFGSVGE